jgi:hypothetical protein
MKPFIHSDRAAKKFGGRREDYAEIDEFLDISKSAHADMRHRALLHHSMGPYICERVFGRTITNSDGKEVSVRDIAELHILEDLGRIPSFSEWCELMPLESWMGNPVSKVRTIDIRD